MPLNCAYKRIKICVGDIPRCLDIFKQCAIFFVQIGEHFSDSFTDPVERNT